MNGHVFRLTDGQIKFLHKPAFCDLCNHIVDSRCETARCTECNRALCKAHWKTNACKNDYGARLLAETSGNLLELNYDDDNEKENDL